MWSFFPHSGSFSSVLSTHGWFRLLEDRKHAAVHVLDRTRCSLKGHCSEWLRGPKAERASASWQWLWALGRCPDHDGCLPCAVVGLPCESCPQTDPWFSAQATSHCDWQCPWLAVVLHQLHTFHSCLFSHVCRDQRVRCKGWFSPSST